MPLVDQAIPTRSGVGAVIEGLTKGALRETKSPLSILQLPVILY